MKPSGADWKYAAIALALAIITYGYLSQMMRSNAESQDASYKLIKLTAKKVPVHARIASNPPEGYRLIQERVSVSPQHVTVIGPEALLEEASFAETAIIDISQTTRKTIKSIPLESVSGVHLSGDPQIVDVTLPIEKIEQTP